MKKFRIVLFALAIALLAAGGFFYFKIFQSNTAFEEQSVLFFIPSGSSYSDLICQLEVENVLQDITSFEWTCRLKKFHERVKPGRYRLPRGSNNNQLVNMFRSGNQEAVLVPVENLHDLGHLAGRLGQFLEGDSLLFADALLDPNTSVQYRMTTEMFSAMFIADSYQMWWTTTPQDFIQRMKKEYDMFWTTERKQKASALELTLPEVAVLASIVKGETAKRDEAPLIARLYLNRLKMGMALQADPTVLFAMKRFDIHRLYFDDYSYPSPYNTYLHTGLPPGPIGLAGPVYLDAVLNPADHSHIYMCAKPDESGYHNFTRSFEQHKINAKLYRDALRKRD
ncbi:MAG: endolytic transglycosylase MltG [Flavobacteriales bacterium]|nr:endolytic transglycosylase MltG [Flavobacteriales bacterium]